MKKIINTIKNLLNKTNSTKPEFTIRENISGYYLYHIADESNIPLCKENNTMSTSLSLKSWGMKTHINERYCKKCNKIYQNMINI